MRNVETDYLVVGAGASGMAFVDALVAGSVDARVVLVDRRDRPGGHWLDAYPFVRLHQPSANYGVVSRPLGSDRIDDTGPNAGFYERATAAQICDHFTAALDDLVASGRVLFLGMSDYRGSDADGHHVTSLLTGADTVIRAGTYVDATYVESEIPSRRTPQYVADEGVRLIPPNDLVRLTDPGDGFTVIGAGKTAMDTCTWLLDAGVDPDSIRWIRPRDAWLFDRTSMQPLDLVASYMGMQAAWVEAAAHADDGHDFAARLESAGVFMRIDPGVRPEIFRGAIISRREIDGLRSIDRVVRGQKVVGLSRDRVALTSGDIPGGRDEVYIDCTARGVPPTVPRPVFEPDRITLQYVTIGIVPWSSATLGMVEASGRDDVEKNRLCPPLTFTGDVADILTMAYAGMLGLATRAAERDVNQWTEACRLNPAAGAMGKAAQPAIHTALTTLVSNMGAALENTARLSSANAIPAARKPEVAQQARVVAPGEEA